MIVVDASVATKWFLPEADSAAAERLLIGPRKLLAPDLIRVEVAAAITRRVRLGQLPDDEAHALVGGWVKALAVGVVTLTPAEDDLGEAAGLALRLRHPLQDCLYLAVAMRLDAPLVTADRTFATRAARVYANVEGLGMGALP